MMVLVCGVTQWKRTFCVGNLTIILIMLLAAALKRWKSARKVVGENVFFIWRAGYLI